MYLLRFYERDEIFDEKISKSRTKLQEYAQKEIDGNLSFRRDKYSFTFISCEGDEIGVIGKIEEIQWWKLLNDFSPREWAVLHF